MPRRAKAKARAAAMAEPEAEPAAMPVAQAKAKAKAMPQPKSLPLPEPENEPMCFESNLPQIPEKTNMERRRDAIMIFALVFFNEYEMDKMEKPASMRRDEFKQLQSCLRAVMQVQTLPPDSGLWTGEEILLRIAWLHQLHSVAVACLREEENQSDEATRVFKAYAITTPIVDSLFVLYGLR